MTMNDELIALYQAWHEDLQGGSGHLPLENLSAPHLVDVPAAYANGATRIAFIGKETRGWGGGKGGVIGDLRRFIELPDGVDRMRATYRDYDFARTAKERSSPFWQMFRKFEAAASGAIVWLNTTHFDFDNGSLGNAPPEFYQQLLDIEAPLLTRELEILRPDFCVFVSGWSMDDIHDSRFPGLRRHNVGDFQLREFARLEHPVLPSRSYRTYHPRHLRRKKFAKLQTIPDLLLANLANSSHLT